MNLCAGTRVCSLAGRVKGTVIRVLRGGFIMVEVDSLPDTLTVLPPKSFKILKPKLTAKDLILLREMRIGL